MVGGMQPSDEQLMPTGWAWEGDVEVVKDDTTDPDGWLYAKVLPRMYGFALISMQSFNFGMKFSKNNRTLKLVRRRKWRRVKCRQDRVALADVHQHASQHTSDSAFPGVGPVLKLADTLTVRDAPPQSALSAADGPAVVPARPARRCGGGGACGRTGVDHEPEGEPAGRIRLRGRGIQPERGARHVSNDGARAGGGDAGRPARPLRTLRHAGAAVGCAAVSDAGQIPVVDKDDPYEYARLCYFDGKHYCMSCHVGDKAPIPAYVLEQCDFRPLPVCVRSLEFLTLAHNANIFDAMSFVGVWRCDCMP